MYHVQYIQCISIYGFLYCSFVFWWFQHYAIHIIHVWLPFLKMPNIIVINQEWRYLLIYWYIYMIHSPRNKKKIISCHRKQIMEDPLLRLGVDGSTDSTVYVYIIRRVQVYVMTFASLLDLDRPAFPRRSRDDDERKNSIDGGDGWEAPNPQRLGTQKKHSTAKHSFFCSNDKTVVL